MPSVSARIEIVEADITRLDVDAIVNAANTQLAPGGGVCGAIHAAAGPELAAACARTCAASGPCPTGDARTTPGFGLRARFVIHAVGPVWHGGQAGEDALLASAYRRALEEARDAGARSIAFPAISTGIFGYPGERAARIAMGAVARYLGDEAMPERVVLACFGAESAEAHRKALAELNKA